MQKSVIRYELLRFNKKTTHKSERLGRCIILLNDQVNKRKEKLKLTKKYFNSPSYLFSDKKESDKNQGKRNT